MEMTINIKSDIDGFNVVIDEGGRFWRLPFIDARGHRRQIKLLKPLYHDGMIVIRIKNKLYKETDLIALQVEKRRKETFCIK